MKLKIGKWDSERAKRWRESIGWTQAQLAEWSGLGLRRIQQIESGRHPLARSTQIMYEHFLTIMRR